MPNVTTLGTFDLPHYGHLNLLKRCYELGMVTVGLNTDHFIKNYKGKPPIMNYEERRLFLNSSGYVHKVIPNDQSSVGSSSLRTIIQAKTELIVIGSDWAKKDYLGQLGITVEDLEENGLSLMYVPYTQGISTTEIKRRVCELA